MLYITIPIYFDPENAAEIEAVKSKVMLDDCHIKNVLFFCGPTAIVADTEKQRDGRVVTYTKIYTDGGYFCSPLNIEGVLQMFAELQMRSKIGFGIPN